MPAANAPLCADCRVNAGELDIRKRHLCRPCFVKYVSTKVVKRMESYRFKNLANDEHRRKLLLPLSGGSCSLTLLSILDKQLRRQDEQRSRTAYDLVLCHVRSPMNQSSQQQRVQDEISTWRERIVSTFPTHSFPRIYDLHDLLKLDNNIETDIQELNFHRIDDESNQAFLARLLSSVRSPTALSDLHEILLQRLLVAVAHRENCQSILWGHSNSRLAARALADVAKGRGVGVPNALADGTSPFGLTFNHPIRDLFRAEIDLFVESLPSDEEGIAGCLLASDERDPSSSTTSVRGMSIDDLLTGYIQSQGEKYPSIMANVVKTAGKLDLPVDTHVCCALCSMPLTGQIQGTKLCYGCDRMKQDIKL